MERRWKCKYDQSWQPGSRLAPALKEALTNCRTISFLFLSTTQASSSCPSSMATTTTTTTANALIHESPSVPFMLPGMRSPELDASGRLVRFDTECVLIPDASPRKQRLVSTKSYSLS